MQNTREMTAIWVRVLKNARKVSISCSVRIRYIKKHKTIFKLRCNYLKCIRSVMAEKKKERKRKQTAICGKPWGS